MKRIFMFLVLGPVTAGIIAAFAAAAAGQGSIAGVFAVALFFLTLPVAAVAATFDAILARPVPVALRAPLIAILGAIVAHALAYILLHWIMPQVSLAPFAIGGAACMGLCSLLAHDCGGEQVAAAQAHVLPRTADS